MSASLYWNFQPHFPIRYINLAGYEGKELFTLISHTLIPHTLIPSYKFKLPAGPPNPLELEELLEHPHIARYARVINQRFNMTSIGTKRSGFEANASAGFVNFRRGFGNMRLHGQSYHRCLAGNATGGIEYYHYDQSYEQTCANLGAMDMLCGWGFPRADADLWGLPSCASY